MQLKEPNKENKIKKFNKNSRFNWIGSFILHTYEAFTRNRPALFS